MDGLCLLHSSGLLEGGQALPLHDGVDLVRAVSSQLDDICADEAVRSPCPIEELS